MADRTKIWIAEAMKKLMAQKPIEKIRVTELCAVAEIQRPTFYYHFRDKYDVVAWIFARAATETDILSVTSAAKGMEQMKKEIVFYRRAYEDNSQNPLWAYMLEYFVAAYSHRAKELLNGATLPTRTTFAIRLYCYGAVGMTKEWLLTDNITPAKTVVEMMFAAMPPSLSAIFFPTET